MFKTTLLSGLLVVILASCGNKGHDENSANSRDSTGLATPPAITDTIHTSQNALDWKGTYKGVVPCADCEGIETILILNEDHTYLRRTKYLGKPGDQYFEAKGTFTWNDKGNTILLSDAENAASQYFVGENQVIQLDLSGARITGKLADQYILAKQ